MAAPLFHAVAPEPLARMLARTRLHDYPDGATVFDRGDRATHAFLVVDGRIRIGTLGDGGKRVTVEIFAPFQLFGEMGVIDGQPRTADAIALGAARLAVIPAEAFQGLLRDSAPFAGTLLQTVCGRLRRTYALFEDASLADLEHRLARQVLYLAGLGATGGSGVRIYSRMRQQDLADLLGTTPRSVITILNKWRAKGLVAFDGRTAQLTILDMDRFAALSKESVL